MKKIKEAIALLLTIYFALFVVANTLYNMFPYINFLIGERFPLAWEIATHRFGILIFSVDLSMEDGLQLCMLNPLNNYGDDWVLYINVTADWLL